MRLAGFLAGDAPVAQWIERQVSTLSVGGSSPLGRTPISTAVTNVCTYI